MTYHKNGKKLMSALFSLLAAAVMLAGCAGSEKTPEKTTETTPQTTNAPDESGLSADVTEEQTPIESVKIEYTEANEKVYSEAKPAPGLKLVQTKKKGIYALKGLDEKTNTARYVNGLIIEFVSDEPQDTTDFVTDLDEDFTQSGYFLNEHLRIYDLDRQLILAEKDSRETGIYSFREQCCGAFEDGFYSCIDDTARFFDLGLNVQKEFKIPVSECEGFVVSDDKRFALVNGTKGRSVLFDVENETAVEMSKGVRAVTLIGKGDGYFDVANTKSERFRIMTTGEVMPLDGAGSGWLPWELKGVCSAAETSPAGLYVLDIAESAAQLFDYPESKVSWTDYADKNCVMFTDSNQRSRFIDRRTGGISGGLFTSYPYICGTDSKGRVLLTAFDEVNFDEDSAADCFRMIIPDELEYAKKLGSRTLDMKTEEYKLFFNDPVPDSEKSAELMKELKDVYNVRVFFGTPTDGEFTDKPYTGRQDIILGQIRDFLALSPPELLSEITPDRKETWIKLSSLIYDDPDSGFDTAGFATDLNGHPYTILETLYDDFETTEYYYDANGMIDEETRLFYEEESARFVVENLAHEIIHLLDKNMSNADSKEWDALNPEDSYTNDKTSTDYDPYYDDYFIDHYARTNQLEDRARTGEYLYLAYQDRGFNTFAYHPALYKKGRVLIRQLRERFPCLKKIPEGEWYLEKPLLGSYDELREKVREEEEQWQNDPENYQYDDGGEDYFAW